ncbi:potassium uptake TrkH family protein [Halopolyspora algeriensis]|uniref:Potassium uptake TrkH family protein n=1 Tax=Halopolyspora algeriensis TaxID=1500506 RepID=A0A368VBB4_9ACTN|nr:potassium transporter TrkG [Halopolyspora algeriensis]RCW38459.1 potassium uptake TrkH family protein [Halopolyspora algeriensis]TQM42660.1 potassium uptake TrkH family protein [Halopolyspora algeriensis]
MVVTGFGFAILVGTALLMLPTASADGTSTNWVTALFTATSAVCVTGLVVVDTAMHWSLFGELVVLGLIQIGGIGIMTLASLLGLLVTKRLGLRMRRTAQTETKSLDLGDVRSVIAGVIAVGLTVEALTAGALTARFVIGYGLPLGQASYFGAFHAVSAFNNAGFALYPDSLTRYATDPWVCVPVLVAVVIGGLGFPVLFAIGRRLGGEQRRWPLHARITLLTYGALVLLGTITVTAFEWTNPDTLGPLGTGGKLLTGLFHGISPRTAGFNTVEVGEMHSATLLVTDILMFIGGGSAGTAGGIKVTTFALLAFVIAAEVRGVSSVHVMGRKLPDGVPRQALTVALLGVGMVIAATLTLLLLSPFGLDAVLFESISAFGTVGLSTGITAELPDAARLVLVVLMFTGRLGPITLASALALRERGRRYELPEERPIVG